MPDGFGDSVGLDILARAGLATPSPPLQMIDLKDAVGSKLRSVSSTDGSEKVSNFTKARYLIVYFVFNLALTLFNKALLIEVNSFVSIWFSLKKNVRGHKTSQLTCASIFDSSKASVSIHINRHTCFGRMYRNRFLVHLGGFYAQKTQQQGFVGIVRVLCSVYGQYCGLQLIAVREISIEL